MPEELRSDEDLVSSFLKGETRAFDLLYERYLPRLNARVASRFNKPEDIEDIVGDIWASALTDLKRFDRNRAKFTTWLFTIANRRINDALRQVYKKPPTVPLIPEATPVSDNIVEMMHEPPEQPQNPVLQFIDSYEAIELNEIKEKIIASLDQDDKLLCQLRFEQALSYEEIHRHERFKELSIPALEVKVCRLKKRIYRQLKEYLPR